MKATGAEKETMWIPQIERATRSGYFAHHTPLGASSENEMDGGEQGCVVKAKHDATLPCSHSRAECRPVAGAAQARA